MKPGLQVNTGSQDAMWAAKNANPNASDRTSAGGRSPQKCSRTAVSWTSMFSDHHFTPAT